MYYAFLLVWIVPGHNRQRRLALGEIDWLVRQVGGNVQEIARLIDYGISQPRAVTSFDSAVHNVNGCLEAPMQMRDRGASWRDYHQIHRDTLCASCGLGNSHKGGQVLARHDLLGWPNGDDAAVMRGGQIIAFFLSAHGLLMVAVFLHSRKKVRVTCAWPYP